MQITEEYVTKLQNEVVERARKLAKRHPGFSWVNCLENAANELCDGW